MMTIEKLNEWFKTHWTFECKICKWSGKLHWDMHSWIKSEKTGDLISHFSCPDCKTLDNFKKVE